MVEFCALLYDKVNLLYMYDVQGLIVVFQHLFLSFGGNDLRGGCLNIKMSYRYKDHHVEDKMVSWLSYL